MGHVTRVRNGQTARLRGLRRPWLTTFVEDARMTGHCLGRQFELLRTVDASSKRRL